MDMNRLEWHMENWATWMRKPAHRLGYPSRSLCMVSGGESTADNFDIMADEGEITSARQIDAIIAGLPTDQQNALHHRWLHSVYRMRNYAEVLDQAMGSVLSMATRRGMT